MPDFDRILAAYEERQTQLVDDVVAELGATAEERARLRLVAQVVQSVVHAYGAFEAERTPGVGGSDQVGGAQAPAAGGQATLTSALSPAPLATEPVPTIADEQAGGMPNLSLRSLVDTGCPTVWQARLLNLSLGLKRSMVISGLPGVGKTALLNALVAQLAGEPRLVVIDSIEDRLPAVVERPDVSQIVSAAGSRSRAAAFRKAAGMKPDWILAGELTPDDLPAFLDALQGSCSGLATMTVEGPDYYQNHPLVVDRDITRNLARAKPLVLHLLEAGDGRPRTVDVLDVAVRGGKAALLPHTGLT